MTVSWTIDELLTATDGRLACGRPSGQVSGISIDSRRLRQGEAFVAITGKRFNGHQFIPDALLRGAGCLIISEPPGTGDAGTVPTILVDDTTKALGRLARFHRQRYAIPVIAVTGSCGKTTTKDLIAHLLGEPDIVLKNPGTQNNHIGLPLALLQLAPAHRWAVVELGANHIGEITYLSSIAQPTMAVITNVGPAHLEFFGSLMNIMHEKLSLLDELPPDGSAVLPGDQLDVCVEAQRHLHPRARTVYFGSTDRCDIQALDVQRAPDPARGMAIRLRDRLAQFIVPLVGYHNVENALAALACVWAAGVPLETARKRLTSVEPPPLRSEVLVCHGVTILNDCYNANPLSFARALETLRDLNVGRKIAIVGDMLELGDYTAAAHQAIGRLATQLGIDEVMAVGEFAEFVAQGVREGQPAPVTTYRSVSDLLLELPSRLHDGDGLLIKGSRRLNLEQVTQFLLQHYRRS